MSTLTCTYLAYILVKSYHPCQTPEG